ncbi:hypothetical protein AQUCO_00300738v1 [Aquilegia coerulea]|uniref:Beta-glucosidase n=1 Tax=Aquilegia coerulea TaxID=218851 RepID=A0A2G5F072_AQUCA|nr:hypothetical protein AQUCO_00300738v1 [Aquilegia coerulea]
MVHYHMMMMVSLSSRILLLLTRTLVVLVVVTGNQVKDTSFSRDDFPSNFVFGAGSSAYQIEGAVAEDGRTPSIWDKFTHEGHMPDHSTADITCDGYHKYKEDVKIMSDIGLEAYRFSISWSRLLPYGRGTINPKGLEYYNSLIDELVAHGIEPHVTLYHIDHPQILEDEYEGWLSPRMIDDFTAFADVCFREFGDRVSHWTTVNEPNTMCLGCYDSGQFPPRRCSPPGGAFNCTAGNSSVEPYIAMHNILLAHASVVAIYREKYQAKQKGLIGINVYAFWCTPLTNSSADVAATQRATDFYTGWVVNPLVFGDYPKIMKKNAGSRIPSFTKRQSELLKGSFDFIGLNHYFVAYIKDNSRNSSKSGPGDFKSDMNVKLSVTNEEMPPGPFLPSFIPYNPSSMQNLLEYFRDYYGNPPIYIHENGFGTPYNETLNDISRIHYVNGYIESMLDAIRSGSNTRGYFLWSFLDVFELLSGYVKRYGLVHVNFEDKDLKREPKLSAQWYSNFLKKNAKLNTQNLDIQLSHSH